MSFLKEENGELDRKNKRKSYAAKNPGGTFRLASAEIYFSEDALDRALNKLESNLEKSIRHRLTAFGDS